MSIMGAPKKAPALTEDKRTFPKIKSGSAYNSSLPMVMTAEPAQSPTSVTAPQTRYVCTAKKTMQRKPVKSCKKHE